MPARFGLAPLAAVALLCACRPEAGGRAWRRLDLWATRPAVEASPFAKLAKAPFRAVVGYLGAKEVRDLARVPAETFAVYPHQAAGQVRVLEQAVGSRLAWRLDPGRDAYLSFTPLLDAASPCAATFRVGVRADGEIVELARVSPTPPAPGRPPLALAAEAVDLSRWAGREVELLVQVDGPAPLAQPSGAPDSGSAAQPCWAGWASPAVWSRGAAASGSDRGGARPGSRERPNVLLLGIDTLRADHVGAYAAPDAPAWTAPTLTPAIDRLAAESDLFLDAYSTFNVTNPSFASILTGLYGKNHGVYDLKTPLPPAHTTLAEVFAGAGYDTLAVISARHLGDHNSGLGQGFAETVLAEEHLAAEMAVETAMDWIGEREDRPFFLWLHLFDPHTPHTPPAPYALGLRPAAPSGLTPPRAWLPFRSPGAETYDQPVLAGNRQLYAGEVAYLDRQVGRLLDFLESRDLLASTVVALVADHGENLGEHGIDYRHIGLWETTTRVPMMVRRPGGQRQGRRLSGLVATLDLFPTLLRVAGLEVPPQDGRDLAELVGPGRPGRPAVFAEHASRMGVTVKTRENRYVRSAGNPHLPDGAYLFDRTADPEETRNLAGGGLVTEARLAELLVRWLGERRPAPEAAPRELSPADLERLRALGYL